MTRLAATTALSLWGIAASGILAIPASAQTTAAPYQTGYRWDAMRRIVGIISPDPDGTGSLPFPAVRYTYDVDGQLTKTEKGTLSAWVADSVLPASWSGFTVIETTTVTYDAGGRKTRETVTAGGATQKITDYSYDTDDRALCTTERMNLSSPPTNACSLSSPTPSDGADRITKNVYDLAGQLVQIRKAVGTSIEQGYVTYSYTANGKQAYIIDANGNRAQQTYDDYDRVYRWIFPSTTRPSAFNPASQATALSTAGSVNSADYEQYTYDKSNNRTALRKRDGSTLTFQYNAIDLLTTKVVPTRTGTPSTATRDVYYGYDLRGLKRFARFDSATGADGVIYTYDAPGRLATSATAMDGVTRTLTYQYDRDGKRTALGFPDSKYFSYGYDYLNRMTGVFEGQSQNTRRITIAYDSAGRRSSLTRTAQDITSYAYDAASRLHILTHAFNGSTGAVQLTFTYNNIGQIKSRASNNASYDWSGDHNVTRNYTTDGLNRYSVAGPASFTYDGNGNLLSDGTVTYTYDVENRVLSASGGLTASVRYDAEGRLYEVSGHRFLYDGDALVAEYNTAGTLLDRYIHGPGVDEPLIWYEGSGLTTANYFHADHQGSIISFSTATGAFRALRTYDSYGLGDSTNNELGRFAYTGQVWIHDLGTYYYKAREYSPNIGRFLQIDPVGYRSNVNLYAYSNNDPIDGRDPTGLYDCTGTKNECRAAAALVKGLNAAARSNRLSKSQRQALGIVSRVLGHQNDHNGVKIDFGNLGKTDTGNLVLGQAQADSNTFTLNTDALMQIGTTQGWKEAFIDGVSTLGHEVQHLSDGPVPGGDIDRLIQVETRGYTISSYVEQAFGNPGYNKRMIQKGAVESCIASTRSISACQDSSRRLFPESYR